MPSTNMTWRARDLASKLTLTKNINHKYIHSFSHSFSQSVSQTVIHNSEHTMYAAGVSMAARQPPADFGDEFSEQVFEQVCTNVKREINQFLDG